MLPDRVSNPGPLTYESKLFVINTGQVLNVVNPDQTRVKLNGYTPRGSNCHFRFLLAFSMGSILIRICCLWSKFPFADGFHC